MHSGFSVVCLSFSVTKRSLLRDRPRSAQVLLADTTGQHPLTSCVHIATVQMHVESISNLTICLRCKDDMDRHARRDTSIWKVAAGSLSRRTSMFSTHVIAIRLSLHLAPEHETLILGRIFIRK